MEPFRSARDFLLYLLKNIFVDNSFMSILYIIHGKFSAILYALFGNMITFVSFL